MANLVAGGLFLLAMFFAPLVQVVPFEAASIAPAVVGFLMMMTAVRQIRGCRPFVLYFARGSLESWVL